MCVMVCGRRPVGIQQISVEGREGRRREGRRKGWREGGRTFGFGDYFLVTFSEVKLIVENALQKNGIFSDLTVPSTL